MRTVMLVYEALGVLIRHRREALGLDQATLAAQMGLRQQAVSGWENGRSRPRRAMLSHLAGVLAVEEGELLDAGEYRPPEPAVRLPVRPLTRALPLDELTEERFEDLLADVMATLHPDGHVSRYGSRGHKQHGIDILVAADGMNLATGQCKRHREFGPAAVEKAIAEVTIAAPKNYLFLSRLVASPAARTEAGKHSTWELWDGEDISRHIRNLPREQAVRIVDTYFPGHRLSFLGVQTPGPWLLPEEHFDASRTMIFNHDWSLAGRQAQLDQISGAAYQADPTVAFLVGAGGVGKTRLLKAVADAAPRGVQVRILPGDAQVTAADFELLPHEGCLIVVIDDAHELAEIRGVVAGIWRRNRDAKIILATRPYGLRTLQEEMARHGLLPVAHKEVLLGDLEFDDAMALAREALGGAAPEAVARRLARITTDSPLATVVGGVLIKQGQLHPGALEQDPNIRLHIMRGFRDALVNDPLASDPPTRRAVLDAIAAVQPFRTGEEAARTTLSAIVGKPYDELHKHLRSLENAGVLRRRGEALRIVPDLLGDVILTEAAFDDTSPLGTGYLERIEPLVIGTSVEHLFINVSRVDWQVRNTRPGAPSLADSLWVAFRARIEAADVFDRGALSESLAKVAYFQPERALELTRWLIDNPTDRLDGEHVVWRGLLTVDYSSVLEALPPVIKLAALTEEMLPEALAQLWELAQGDVRPTNPYPSHPLRVLREVAEFGVAKPIWFNNMVIDIVSTWFADGQRVSPFHVLEPMLATEGDDSTVRGHAITFQPFALRPESITSLRQRVIDLAFEELKSPDLRRSGAAAKFLNSAVQFPKGLFGRPVSAEERDGWTPGIVETINRLGVTAAADGLDPAVLVSVRDALYWHDNYGTGPAHEAAARAIESLPGGVEALLGLMVHDGWGRLVRDRGDNFEAIEAKRTALIMDVVEGLSSRTDQEVVDLLIARLDADLEVHGATDGNPGPLIEGLIEARPTLARTMLETLRVSLAPNGLDRVLPVVLSAFAAHNPEAALADIKLLLGGTSVDRRRAAAQAIGWNRGLRELHSGELDLLIELASDPDVVIRRNVARAAQLVARTQTAEAIRLLAAIRFGDDEGLADDFFMSFRLEHDISWSSFSEPELDLIRQDLVTLPGLAEYSVSKALADRSATNPEWVLELLMERIKLAESLDSIRGYDALPYTWGNQLRIRDTPAFATILSGILTWISEGLDSWVRRRLGADLFSGVAVEYDSQVVDVLSRSLVAGTEKMTLAVAAVLHAAPRTFIWDEPDFVGTALRTAARLGGGVQQKMIDALRTATISGMRSGTPGEPFPETIEQRDRSREIAKDLSAGSIERRFYTDMAKSAERDILRDIDDDLPADGRNW